MLYSQNSRSTGPAASISVFPGTHLASPHTWLLHAPIWQEHTGYSFFCTKAESHKRVQTRSSSPSLNPDGSLSATFQFFNPHWKCSLSNSHLFLWHLPPFSSMSSTHLNSPSECIYVFLSITDGHILISHHTDLQSNFAASSPKSAHFHTWRSCLWLFSWPLPVSLKAEPQPTWTLHKQQWKKIQFF